ncbi:MAG: helix-turn-helix transcriptional regulator [Atopobiaceae bacterium]|nr:helix-turn-helix transcriptional regulator [Atopobiaceae bacterium]
MEFSEKLQELRKARSLTQEQLAAELYVSRTAVSKWESGRGYPSIDSLREISRFFSVTIDELISPDEVVSAAQEDKRTFTRRYASLVCGMLDVLPALLLIVPVFGNGPGDPASVSLLSLSGVSVWIKATFAAYVGVTVLCGLCEVAASRTDASWGRAALVAGIGLSAVSVAVFILARQPYAGITCFALLATKSLLLWRRDR